MFGAVSKFSHYLHTSGETAAKLFNELVSMKIHHFLA